MLTLPTKAQELLDNLAVGSKSIIWPCNFFDIIEPYYCRSLTNLLCSKCSLDSILKIDSGYYYLKDCGLQFKLNHISDNEPLFRWHDSLIGPDKLTSEQITRIQNILKIKLYPIKIVYRDRLSLNPWEESYSEIFDNALSFAVYATLS